MKTLKTGLFLIFSMCLLDCAFEENRRIEKKLTLAVNDFHFLFNQEKFGQIYSQADEELWKKITEQQFISYLEVVKNDVGELKEIRHISLEDDLKDAIERIRVKRTKFSHIEIIFTEKAIYREKFEWNLKKDEVKLVQFAIEKICSKPCRLNIETK